jgi:transcriptional regulator with XRE-family HTH domain
MADLVFLDPRRRPRPLLRSLVGGVLRRHRQRQGRTLADVARTARMSMPYLSEVERGRKEASSEVLAAVCAALGIDLSDLLAEVWNDLAAEPVAGRRDARRRDAAEPAAGRGDVRRPDAGEPVTGRGDVHRRGAAEPVVGLGDVRRRDAVVVPVPGMRRRAPRPVPGRRAAPDVVLLAA